MYYVAHRYGNITEITEIEKESSKVRIHHSRKRVGIYGPRRPDNIRRTKKTCLRCLLSALKKIGCPLLVTLTFSGDASDASYANDSLRRFQVRLRALYPKAQSLFVPELSPRGRIHFHGVLFGLPLRLGDKSENKRIVRYGDERKTRTLARLWGEGYVDVRQTDGSRRLAYYIAKYITKGGGETLFNAMRMIRMSRGFPRETIIRGKEAEKLARSYASTKKPIEEWETEKPYSGRIVIKKYED